MRGGFSVQFAFALVATFLLVGCTDPFVPGPSKGSPLLGAEVTIHCAGDCVDCYDVFGLFTDGRAMYVWACRDLDHNTTLPRGSTASTAEVEKILGAIGSDSPPDHMNVSELAVGTVPPHLVANLSAALLDDWVAPANASKPITTNDACGCTWFVRFDRKGTSATIGVPFYEEGDPASHASSTERFAHVGAAFADAHAAFKIERTDGQRSYFGG